MNELIEKNVGNIDTVNKISPKLTVLDYWEEYPLEEKTVLILGLGSMLRGSMLYVMQELHESRFEGYHIYVHVLEETKDKVLDIIQKYNFHRAVVVEEGEDYKRILATAKYLITEVKFPAHWIKREGQIPINTWHGTPLKCLGLDKNSKVIHKDGRTQRNFIDAEYLLYPNEYTKEHMLDAYRVRNLTSAKALMCGYPRTSILMDPEKSRQAHEKLAPNGEKTIAYMPTWRAKKFTEDFVKDMQFMLLCLDKNLTDQQILYVNLHHRITNLLNYEDYTHIRQFPDDMDNYEVLAGMDVCITDYSSVFFDFLVTRRKIVLFCADEKEYFGERGAYMELSSLPFSKAYSITQLVKEINTPKDYDDEQIFNELCSYDSVDNAKLLSDLFIDDTSRLHIEPIQGNGKENVIIYSEQMQEGASTSFLRKYIRGRSLEDYNLYLSGKDMEIDQNKKAAYPMLREANAFGVPEGLLMTRDALDAEKMYKNGKLDFVSYIERTKECYSLENKRVYGNCYFRIAVLFESTDPQRILAYSQMSSEKILFLQDSMLTVMEEGDTLLKDACLYMAEKCLKLYTITEDCKQRAAKVLGDDIAERINLVQSHGELDEIIKEVLHGKGV